MQMKENRRLDGWALVFYKETLCSVLAHWVVSVGFNSLTFQSSWRPSTVWNAHASFRMKQRWEQEQPWRKLSQHFRPPCNPKDLSSDLQHTQEEGMVIHLCNHSAGMLEGQGDSPELTGQPDQPIRECWIQWEILPQSLKTAILESHLHPTSGLHTYTPHHAHQSTYTSYHAHQSTHTPHHVHQITHTHTHTTSMFI